MFDKLSDREIVSRVVSVCKNLRKQDNRATSYPMVYVQEKMRAYGDFDSNDGCVAFLYHGQEVDDESSDEFLEAREFYNKHGYFGDGYEDWDVTGYIDIWVNKQVFFTVHEAERYVEKYRYKLRNPQIYIASGYMNDEWKLLREFLGRIYDGNIILALKSNIFGINEE